MTFLALRVTQELAYQLYEKRRCAIGHDWQDWLEADLPCVNKANLALSPFFLPAL